MGGMSVSEAEQLKQRRGAIKSSVFEAVWLRLQGSEAHAQRASVLRRDDWDSWLLRDAELFALVLRHTPHFAAEFYEAFKGKTMGEQAGDVKAVLAKKCEPSVLKCDACL